MTATTGILKRDSVPLPAILGLDKAPGDCKSQSRFFYQSPLIAQRLSLLKNMVGGRSLVVVVVGERGSGKTTLMNRFIADVGRHNRIGRIRLKARRSAHPAACRELNDRMIFVSKKKSAPTVIVDDAHQLSPKAVKLLLQSAISTSGERRLQNIILFADPGMRERFAEIARWLPPQSVIDKIFMTPLTEKQTMEYLRHRLKTAGLIRKNPFTNEQMQTIYRLSGGLPGWINGEAFMQLKRMSRSHQGFRRSWIAPVLQALQGQLRWMDKIPCFSRN